jgi:uroporphyrinogen decarboxylase
MNHRQRALAALRHQEPDRIPIDFGGTVDSTIAAQSYQALRQALGLPPRVTRVCDVIQYTAVLEDDVRQALGIDTTPIDDLAPGGGYVFAAIHNIQVGVPIQNVMAMFQTALEYGVY